MGAEPVLGSGWDIEELEGTFGAASSASFVFDAARSSSQEEAAAQYR